MTNFHFTFTSKEREGTYHFRLYTYDGTGISVPTGHPIFPANSLAEHMAFAGVLDPVDLGNRVVKSFGDHAVHKENELQQGLTQIELLKLELHSTPALLPLYKAVRETTNQIWLEVVLEQPVIGAVSLPGDFVAPRKRRMWFWGSINRKDFQLAPDTQKLKKNGGDIGYTTALLALTSDHRGSMAMTFTSWLKVRLADNPKAFLDDFKAKFTLTEDFTPLSELFYYLLKWITPTQMFAISDSRVAHQGMKAGPLDEWVNQANLLLTYQFVDGLNFVYDTLDNIGIRVRTNGGDSALFAYDANGSAGTSLYSLKDLGSLLIGLSSEMLLFPQVEIPTLDEAFGSFSWTNDFQTRMSHWPGVTRWLFLELGQAPLKVFVDPDISTIKHTPAGAWAGSYKVTESTATGLIPDPSFAIVKGLEGGSDEARTLLFRFVGQSYQSGSLVDDARGFELYGLEPLGGWRTMKSVTRHKKTYASWALFHATRYISVWGSTMGLLEITSRGVGLEPFGANDPMTPNPPDGVFGMMDFGDFPIMRQLTVQVGIMPQPLLFSTISVTRPPGGSTQFKLAEVIDFDGSIPAPRIQLPPTPPPPTPPTLSLNNPSAGATVSGTASSVKATATDDVAVVQVTLKVDTTFIDTHVAVPSTKQYIFSWDTTKFANGPHTIFVTAFDNANNTSVVTAVVTVSN